MKLLSQMTTDISIHALLAESDGCRIEHDAAVAYDFYPRSPCGERPHGRAAAGCGIHISIHALLAESDAQPMGRAPRRAYISIHALLAESDDDLEPSKTRRLTFLSTLSLRRATQGADFGHKMISNFYPRSPCGERREHLRKAL